MSQKTEKLTASTSSKEDRLVRITFDAPASLRKAFKLKAAHEERSLKEVFYELMEGYVRGEDKS